MAQTMKYIIQKVTISMNKSDFKLILFVTIVTISFILLAKIDFSKGQKIAKVYYDNELIKTIDLSIDSNHQYKVKGYNGDVIIEAKLNSIRVMDEVSPLNICSKQGWVSSHYEVIVCLPNKVVIKIESEESPVDTVVR